MTTGLIGDDELQERIRLAPGQLIATRIKRARKTADLSHDELGERCGGVTRQHLIKLEKATHRPRAAMLRRIADATERPVDWFVDPDQDPSPFPVDGSGGRVDRGVAGIEGEAA